VDLRPSKFFPGRAGDGLCGERGYDQDAINARAPYAGFRPIAADLPLCEHCRRRSDPAEKRPAAAGFGLLCEASGCHPFAIPAREKETR
jgi:hypothetical protein